MSARPFEGVRVLVPVTPERRQLAERLSGAGARVDEAEFIAIEPPEDVAPLREAVVAWCRGDYDWLAVTSRNAVLAMARLADAAGTTLSAPQPAARVATVGEATRSVCADVGLEVALVPSGRQAAAGIVADFPHGSGHVLVPRGNLAAPTLERGISRRGWDVTTVEAYRTVDGPGADEATVAAVHAGEIDAVLLTSGSVAERFASQCGAPPAGTMMVAIGRTTAAAAHAAGLTVDIVSATPSYDGIASALADALAAKGEA